MTQMMTSFKATLAVSLDGHAWPCPPYDEAALHPTPVPPATEHNTAENYQLFIPRLATHLVIGDGQGVDQSNSKTLDPGILPSLAPQSIPCLFH